jgi:hypothetical protein
MRRTVATKGVKPGASAYTTDTVGLTLAILLGLHFHTSRFLRCKRSRSAWLTPLL